MDYAETITAKRVQKVLQKENIDSSFIYFELAKNNQNAIEQIEKAESLEALNTFFEEMCEKYFLHYNVKIKEFREKISKEGWKGIFLQEITDKYGDGKTLKVENNEYRLIGLPLFNEKIKPVFLDSMNKYLDVNLVT